MAQPATVYYAAYSMYMLQSYVDIKITVNAKILLFKLETVSLCIVKGTVHV